MSSRTVTIDGLCDKDGYISEPWSQLYELIHSVAQQLQWKIGTLFHLEGSEFRFFCILLLVFLCFILKYLYDAHGIPFSFTLKFITTLCEPLKIAAVRNFTAVLVK